MEGRQDSQAIGKERSLPDALFRYRQVDFAQQQKIRFAYFLNLSLIVFCLFAILLTAYIQVSSTIYKGLYLPVLLPELVVLGLFFICLFLLLRGYYSVAANMLLGSAIAALWMVIFFDKGAGLLRMDTIAILMALLTMPPLLLRTRKYSIFLYGAINLLILFVFTLLLKDRGQLSETEATDYLIDNSLAIIFISVVGYNIFMVNKRSLDRAMEDIRQREIAERAKHESQEQFRSLIEFAPCLLMLTEPGGKILIVNKAFTIATGFSSDEAKGRTIEDLGLPLANDLDQFGEKFVEPANEEFRMTHKLGYPVDVFVSSRFIRLGGNRVILSAALDITEKKKIERELEIHRNHLEFLVQARTNELDISNRELLTKNRELHDQGLQLEETLRNLREAQNQLVQSEKLASLGLLAAGIAHEINNPLNFITSGIQVLENYFDEQLKEHKEAVRSCFEAIQSGAGRAADIVTSLNRYSRQTETQNERCDIHAIINNCLLILNNRTKGRISINKIFTDESFVLFGNEGKLHQAVLNILSNSEQAIEGNGKIHIETSCTGDNLRVQISDTGIGIRPEDLSRICDPFFTTKEPGKGTGLGLSITYSIIKELHGYLEFTSEVGVGTSVVILLPVNAA